MHARRNSRRARLQSLRAADLAAVGCYGSIVGHVLRLERRDRESAFAIRSRKPGNDQRFADVRAGALKHQTSRCHQNSIPAWALTPAAK